MAKRHTRKRLRPIKRRARTRKHIRKPRKYAQRGGSASSPAAAASKASPFFKEAYVITMPESPERLNRIKAQASLAGIPLQPFPGVRIKPEDRDTLPPLGVGSTHYKDRTGATFNLGTIGAFLAHRNLMNHIAKAGKGKPGTLIFEDDVVIPPDFYARLAAVAPEIPSDWDFIFLDKMYPNGKMISPHIMKLERDMTTKKNWGIWGFIVRNESVASKVLPILEHMIDIPDHQLNKFADKLKMYLIQPGIVKPDDVTASQSVVTKFDKQKGGVEASIHVVLAANEMRPTLEALIRSLAKHGYSHDVYGLGQPWQGFPTKMKLYLEGIKKVRETKGDAALITLLDAFDTFAIRPASVAAAAYLAKPRRMPILFSAEVVCGGNCREGVLDWYDYHKVKGGTAAVKAAIDPSKPPSHGYLLFSNPTVLNSGMIMGPAADMEAMLTEMIASGEPDDQLAAGDYFINHMDKVDLDVEEKVFRNKIMNHAKLPDEDASHLQGPAFIHFPGQRSEAQQKHISELYKAYNTE